MYVFLCFSTLHDAFFKGKRVTVKVSLRMFTSRETHVGSIDVFLCPIYKKNIKHACVLIFLPTCHDVYRFFCFSGNVNVPRYIDNLTMYIVSKLETWELFKIYFNLVKGVKSCLAIN